MHLAFHIYNTDLASERGVQSSPGPTAPAQPSRQEQLRVCSERVGMSSMMREASDAPKYMGATDEMFELVYAVPYVWNRAIVYDGAMLHAAHIDEGATTEALDCDPSKGRLAASIFLSREA